MGISYLASQDISDLQRYIWLVIKGDQVRSYRSKVEAFHAAQQNGGYPIQVLINPYDSYTRLIVNTEQGISTNVIRRSRNFKS